MGDAGPGWTRSRAMAPPPAEGRGRDAWSDRSTGDCPRCYPQTPAECWQEREWESELESETERFACPAPDPPANKVAG